MEWKRFFERCVKGVLVAYVLVSFYFQHDMGLADNGDFARSFGPFSSGPILNAPGNSASYSFDDRNRYMHHWLPYWHFDPAWKKMRSSTTLLWIPGAALNGLFYSDTVLHAAALGLVPKTLAIVALLLVFRWIDRGAAQYRILFYLTFAAPLATMISCQAYLAFMNTFYQETGSFAYTMLFFAGVLLLEKNPRSKGYFALSLFAAILLACAKQSGAYLPILAIPVLLFCTSSTTLPRDRFRRYLRLGIPLTAGIVALAVFVTQQPDCTKNNQFNSLFCGGLTFSNDPDQRLKDLGLGNASECLGKTAFMPEGERFVRLHSEKLSYLNPLRAILKEPMIPLRALTYAAGNMQDITLEYLGKHAAGDPRAESLPPAADDGSTRTPTPSPWKFLNLWADMKFRIFPTGIAFFLACLIYAAVFAFGLRQPGFCRGLSAIGLFAVTACFADMAIAILGDGRNELVKHLFLSNLMFDLATIAWLNVLISLVPRFGVRSAECKEPDGIVRTRFSEMQR